MQSRDCFIISRTPALIVAESKQLKKHGKANVKIQKSFLDEHSFQLRWYILASPGGLLARTSAWHQS